MKVLRILNRAFLVTMLLFVSACTPTCTVAHDAKVIVKSQEIPLPPEGTTAIHIPLDIETHPKAIGILVQAYLWFGGQSYTPVGAARGQGEVKEDLVIVSPLVHQRIQEDGIAWIRMDTKFVYKKGDTSVPTLMSIKWEDLNTDPISWWVKIIRPPKIFDLEFPEYRGGQIKFRVDHRSNRLIVAYEWVCDQTNLEYCQDLVWDVYKGENQVSLAGSYVTIPTDFTEEGQRGHFHLCVVDGAEQIIVFDKYVEYRGWHLVEIPQPDKGFWGPLDSIGRDEPTNFYGRLWMPETDLPPIEKVEMAKMTDLKLEGWDFLNVGLLFVEGLLPGGRIPP